MKYKKSLHFSDCAIYNGPAYPIGHCNCGGARADKIWWRRTCRHVHILEVSAQISLARWLENLFQIREKCASQECSRIGYCLLLDKPVVFFGPFGLFHKCPAEQFVNDRDNKIEATACCGSHRKLSYKNHVNVTKPNPAMGVISSEQAQSLF